MTAAEYLNGRRKYQRPQAMLWANNSGTIEQLQDELYYVPLGSEIGAESYTGSGNSFIILSDDNRQEIDFSTQRIESRRRTINGRMRSYHIADKLTISTSWDMLPSRSFALPPNFKETAGSQGISNFTGSNSLEFTTDGGAGGNEMLDWYQNHTGSFWVYLAYDKYTNFGKDEEAYKNLQKYNQIIEVFFSDFQYSVVKRGGSNHDFWNISVVLEEV